MNSDTIGAAIVQPQSIDVSTEPLVLSVAPAAPLHTSTTQEAASRGPGRPCLSNTVAPLPEPVETNIQFEIIPNLLKDAPVPANKRKKAGNPKVEITTLDPLPMDTSSSWDDFLDRIAAAAAVPKDYLVISSFEWCFSIPANSPKVRVASEQSYQSMINKIRETAAKKTLPYVNLHMKYPKYVAPVSFFFDSGLNC